MKNTDKNYRKINYGGALVDSREINAIIKSIKISAKTGGWQTGPEASKMEQEACKFLGVKYGVLCNSGSSAGLLALSALELPKGSEVIISACTFPTIFNIILQCGLVPVIVDAKVGTYNFDVGEVEQAITKKTKAIIAVHAVGNPCDMPKLMKLVKKHKIYVIEDNCDGWGSTIGEKKVGSFGDISITSFHAAHIVSMGVGGGVFCNDEKIAERVRMYRDWGRQAKTTEKRKVDGIPDDYNPRFIYDKIGYNFQILELQAAMGRVQLKKADKIKKLRNYNFRWICKEIEKRKYPLITPISVAGADVCWFSIPLTCDGVERGFLTDHLEKAGIETRSMFSGDITRHPAYKNSKFRVSGKLTEADIILKDSFWISCHPRLTHSDRLYIIKTFDNFFKK